MQPTNQTIRCYSGDDFELTVYPKDSTGQPIPILPSDTAYFRIADRRGSTSTVRIPGDATIESISGGPYAIIARIDSVRSSQIANGYVYDIGYVKSGKTVTVLTGSFNVVERVSP
jgi:hypothetical protein